MGQITTKYLVADEDGPLRAFYSLAEAQAYAGAGRTITELKEVRYSPKAPTYEELLEKYGEAPW